MYDPNWFTRPCRPPPEDTEEPEEYPWFED